MPDSVEYPMELLPPPNFNLSISHDPGNIRSNMTLGRARQRRRQTNERVFITANWLFSPSEIHIWRSFVKDDLALASKWFRIPLKLGIITREFELRIIDNYREAHKPVNYWEVSATLELYDMQDATSAEVQAAILYFQMNPEVPEFGGVLDARIENFSITTNTIISTVQDRKFIRVNSATDVQITLGDTTGFSDHYFFVMSRIGAGEVEFLAGPGVTIDSEDDKRFINKQKTTVCVHRVSNNHYHIYGDLRA